MLYELCDQQNSRIANFTIKKGYYNLVILKLTKFILNIFILLILLGNESFALDEHVDIKVLLGQKKDEKLSLDEVLKCQHRITLPVSNIFFQNISHGDGVYFSKGYTIQCKFRVLLNSIFNEI